MYDLTNIVPWVKEHKISPVSGEKLTLKQLTRLHFHKYACLPHLALSLTSLIRNGDGKYHCPVTFKVFTPSTKIAAVKTTGNVYAHEAIQEFNVKVYMPVMYDMIMGMCLNPDDVDRLGLTS